MSHANPERWIRVRLLFTALVFTALFGVIAFRAYQLQVVDGKRLREMAQQQYLKEITLPARRGVITDRNGAPLALSVDVDSIHANPRMIGSKAPAVAAALAKVLGIEVASLQRRLSSRRYFTWVKRRVSAQQAKAVKALGIRGVFLQKESKRFYPNRGLGSTVVGYAGLDSKGLEGVELSLDRWLRGSPVRVAGLRDARGRPVLAEGFSAIPKTNHDVVLSIDKAIQFETEQALDMVYRAAEAKWAAAVVLDTKTGDILAMASAPAFDPNHPASTKPASRRNRALTDTFEPGSTMKLFSVAAALAGGVVKDDEMLYAEKGRMRIGRHVIHDSKPYEYLSLSDVLKKSSNIAVSKLALRLGKKRLYQALKRFGFGERTGIPLRGERSGRLRPPRRWSQVGLANIAFGQGLTTTVLQLARALTAVANGGKLMQPRLVLRVQDESGRIVRDFPPQGRQVMSASLAARLRYLLRGVTQAGGTAEAAALERYTVAGKTGTAQKVDAKRGTYSEDKYVASFIGVTPASRPRLAIAIVVDEAASAEYHGGDVAGPVFRRIASRALRYLGVKPDVAAGPRQRVAKRKQKRARRIQAAVELAPPLPTAGSRGRHLVPDFTGMSMAEALASARQAGLKPRLVGSGRAVAQTPGPGLAHSPICTIAFRPPG